MSLNPSMTGGDVKKARIIAKEVAKINAAGETKVELEALKREKDKGEYIESCKYVTNATNKYIEGNVDANITKKLAQDLFIEIFATAKQFHFAVGSAELLQVECGAEAYFAFRDLPFGKVLITNANDTKYFKIMRR